MTEDIKKMIESVERYGAHQITKYSFERAKAGLTERRFVREFDFDRIVEELTKENNQLTEQLKEKTLYDRMHKPLM